MLLCFFSLSTAAMFLILASTSTHSPFSTIGSHREMVQMMAYEPMELLTAVGFYLATGTFRVLDIVKADIPAILYAAWGVTLITGGLNLLILEFIQRR